MPPWPIDEDIDSYFQRVKDAGATVVQEPTDQYWGHRDWGITDPDGYLLFISKVTREVSAESMREAALAGSPAAINHRTRYLSSRTLIPSLSPLGAGRREYGREEAPSPVEPGRYPRSGWRLGVRANAEGPL